MARLEKPDAGYAWVVVLSACLINLILSGMARMVGILYVALIEVYGVSRQEASVPFTVRNAVRYLTGPVVGVLGQRWGIRAVTFAGGFIAALGSIFCCYAPNVTWISIFWGGIHGLGFSMGNTLFQVVVNQYFDKYRATASGIVLSGSCFGAFVLPLLLEWMLGSYGLFGCFLILGGLFLNVMPPSLLLKEPPWVEDPDGYDRRRALIEGKSGRPHSLEGENKRAAPRSHSNISMPDFDMCSVVNGTPQNRWMRGSEWMKQPNTCEFPTDSYYVVCTSYRTTNLFSENTSKQEANKNGKSPVYYIDKPVNLTPEHPLQNKKTAATSNKSLLQIVKNIGLLYKNPVYILINVNVATYFWLFIPVLTVVMDYSRDKGIREEDRKYLIHALTVGDLVGRLCFGWVTDRRLLSFSIYMALVFTLQGLFVAFLPFALCLWQYMVLLALYGVVSGIIFVYFPVLVHKYVDQENQAIAVGCVGLLSGIVTFGIPPVIGYFRDNIGSYDGFFHIIGALSLVTGCLWLLEPLYTRNLKEET